MREQDSAGPGLDGRRESLRSKMLSFVQSCNRVMNGAAPRSTSAPTPTVSTPSVVAALRRSYAAWASARDDEYLAYVLQGDVDRAARSCELEAAAIIDALVLDATPHDAIIAWLLHEAGAINYSCYLVRALFPHGHSSTPSRHGVQALVSTVTASVTDATSRRILDYLVACLVSLEDAPKSAVTFLRPAISAIIETFNTSDDDEVHEMIVDAFRPHKHHATIRSLLREQLVRLASQPSPTPARIERLGSITDVALFLSVLQTAVTDPAVVASTTIHPGLTALIGYYHREGPQLLLQVLSLAHDLVETGLQAMTADIALYGLRLAAQACADQQETYYRWFEVHFGVVSPMSPSLTAMNAPTSQAVAPTVCLRPSCALLTTKRSLQFMSALLTDELHAICDASVIEMTLRVFKTHATEFPEFVWTYVSLARTRLQQLKSAATVPIPNALESAREATATEVEGYVAAFLDTGRVSSKLRQRILMQGNVWQTVLKPYLLHAEMPHTMPFSMLLGWAQLTHALVHEKSITEAEYAPFVRRVHTLVSSRVAYAQSRQQTLSSVARQLVATSLVPGPTTASALIGRMTARVRGTLLQPNMSLDALLADIRGGCSEMLAAPCAETVLPSMHGFLVSITALPDVGALRAAFLTWLHADVAALHHGGWLLGATACAMDDSQGAVALLEARIAVVAPDSIVDVFRLCFEFTESMLLLSKSHNDDVGVSVRLVQFLYWVSLRHHYHGLDGPSWLPTSIRRLEERLFEQRAHVLESTAFFPVWLEFELHVGHAASAYRIECLAMHFMSVKDRVDAAAISTVCSMGKELLRHQDTCHANDASTPLHAERDRVAIHPCWTRMKKRKRPHVACDVGLGVALFQQALTMVMNQSSKKGNLVTAIVNVLTERAMSRVTACADVVHKASYVSVFLELLLAVVVHGPMQPRAYMLLQAFATTHMADLAPWHPRTTSILLAASLFSGEMSPQQLQASLAPIVLASVVYFWPMVNAALVPESAVPPLLGELHADLVLATTRGSTHPYPTEWRASFLKLARFWLAWGMTLELSTLEAKLLLRDEQASVCVIEDAHAAWSEWIEATDANTNLVLHPLAGGQIFLTVSTGGSLRGALWWLLVVQHLHPTAHMACIQLHRAAWLEQVARACATYVEATTTTSTATPPWLFALASVIGTSVPTFLAETVVAGARLNLRIENAQVRDAVRRLLPDDLHSSPLADTASSSSMLW
ncbi:hypothetical protein SPRG_03534 [Saprolegnia parasitica CBS 223.65]|uniref:Uncharacterized protein n=1 Tax=Saprolegnia parasitica (strain CBS 223.65) TaxID=695850 RepID=A0A067CLN6_SAPPC|nr:hypothetical protein SPRG_03534 [Saprolegnia parasitica CBS 223.65]KDO31614.1 hypothetical protein SPRG_03534 [Saprolegnia parasitica CBS 223.65]|eukprot:XP_012197504.1 hypothetical protein SPRG_03534 [Saprolegnia parasitica CBS 223.65]